MSWHARPEEMHGIRTQTAGHGGWRVTIRRRGIEETRSFSIKRYGSLEAALEAAKLWRDVTSRSTPALTRAEVCSMLKSNNTSGHPGVFFRRQIKRNRAGKKVEYLYWQALTPDGMKPACSRTFSIAKFGNEQAHAMAVNVRDGYIAQLEGVWLPQAPVSLHPVAQTQAQARRGKKT